MTKYLVLRERNFWEKEMWLFYFKYDEKVKEILEEIIDIINENSNKIYSTTQAKEKEEQERRNSNSKYWWLSDILWGWFRPIPVAVSKYSIKIEENIDTNIKDNNSYMSLINDYSWKELDLLKLKDYLSKLNNIKKQEENNFFNEVEDNNDYEIEDLFYKWNIVNFIK